jgi:hypothetical protein
MQLASAGDVMPALSQTQAMPMPRARPMVQMAAADGASTKPLAPIRLASMSPNDIVSSRGLWDSLMQQAAAKAPETNGTDVSSARRNTSGRDMTASVGPFAAPRDRVPSDVALAYAAQPDAISSRANATVTTQGAASIVNKPDLATNVLNTRATERIDDPWLRGLVLTNNVQNSLVVTQVGDPDFTSFTTFMQKPRSSVVMTFSADPYLGVTTEQFSGSAVVFPATVTFAARRQ